MADVNLNRNLVIRFKAARKDGTALDRVWLLPLPYVSELGTWRSVYYSESPSGSNKFTTRAGEAGDTSAVRIDQMIRLYLETDWEFEHPTYTILDGPVSAASLRPPEGRASRIPRIQGMEALLQGKGERMPDDTEGTLKDLVSIVQSTLRDSSTPDEAQLKMIESLLKKGGTGDMGTTTVTPGEDEAAPAPEARDIIRPNGTAYRTRVIEGGTDVDVLRRARANQFSVLAYGPPGTGKTAMVEAAYAGDDLPEKDRQLFTIMGTGDTETADFIGGYVQMPDGKYMWVDGPLLLAMEAGAPLQVDEIALIDPKVLAVLYSVMDGRGELVVTANPERGVVRAKKGFYVVGTCNPNAPGARMSEALVSRFPLQFHVGTDFTLARELGVPARLVTVARNMQNNVSTGQLGWAPQLRELLATRDLAEEFGQKFALRALIAGAPEIDRPRIQDLMSRAHGMQLSSLEVQ